MRQEECCRLEIEGQGLLFCKRKCLMQRVWTSGLPSCGIFCSFTMDEHTPKKQEGRSPEEYAVDAAEEFRMCGGGVERGKPLTEDIQRAFEADPGDRNLIRLSGFKQEGSNEIIGDPVHMDFAMNHRGGETAQDIHAQGGLVMTQKQFDRSTQAIEFGDIDGGKNHRVEECGGQDNGAGSETSGLDLELEKAHGQEFRQPIELLRGKPVRTFVGFAPERSAIIHG